MSNFKGSNIKLILIALAVALVSACSPATTEPTPPPTSPPWIISIPTLGQPDPIITDIDSCNEIFDSVAGDHLRDIFDCIEVEGGIGLAHEGTTTPITVEEAETLGLVSLSNSVASNIQSTVEMDNEKLFRKQNKH